jgi:small GTP-binding protein
MEKENFGKFADYDFLIKVVLIGDAAVGKSSLLLKYIDDVFEDSYVCTIGVDFKIKSLVVDRKRVKLQVWDTAGQERFKPITKCYFRGSHGCVVLFDITNKASFQNVRSWIIDYRDNNTVDSAENIVLIGNKADREDERAVTLEEAQLLAETLGVSYTETSAKSGEGVAEAFEAISKVVIKNLKHDFLVVKPKEYNLDSKPLNSEQKLHKKGCCFS